MKRIGYLHEQVYDIENIEIADDKARKNKSIRWGIVKHDRNRQNENERLSEQLRDLVYETSEYSTFKVYEPKERLIFRLPYYPDRITHHAIMNVMEPIWTKIFIKQTYSCIKNRGIHNVAHDLKTALIEHPEETTYCLKMDVRKFYPSVNHDILCDIIKKKIKDKYLLTLLIGIIYSADGVPIGNYLSQFFANLYLAYFDHWVKEELKCKFYFRYADDIVILSSDKNFLRNVLIAIKMYLKEVLNLRLKSNYQIFPVDDRGVDFVGYRFYHTHVLLRRRMQSYFGWLKFCNSKNLLRKIQRDTGLRFSNWDGKKSNISRFYNKYIHIVDIVSYSKCFRVNFVYNNKSYYFESKSRNLFYSLTRYSFPVNFKIRPYVRTKKNRNGCAARLNREIR